MKRKDFEIVRGDSTTFSWELEGDKRTTNFLFGIKKSNNISDARLISKTIFTKTYDSETNTTNISLQIEPAETEDLQYKTLYYDLIDEDAEKTEYTGKISNVFDVITGLDGIADVSTADRLMAVDARDCAEFDLFQVRIVNGQKVIQAISINELKQQLGI